MSVHVEFLGMPRQYAGCSRVELDAGTLGDALQALAVRFPEIARHCIRESAPRSGYLVCVNGAAFTSDPAHRLRDGDSLQLLAADVGGH